MQLAQDGLLLLRHVSGGTIKKERHFLHGVTAVGRGSRSVNGSIGKLLCGDLPSLDEQPQDQDEIDEEHAYIHQVVLPGNGFESNGVDPAQRGAREDQTSS